MPLFGSRSNSFILQCHPSLQELAHCSLEVGMDFSVTAGHREEEAQNAAFHDGLSEKEWPDSLHNKLPSLAIHFVPYPIDWSNHKRFYHLAGIVRSVAVDIGIVIQWGGDWDRDFDLDDQKFMDLAHYGLIFRST